MTSTILVTLHSLRLRLTSLAVAVVRLSSDRTGRELRLIFASELHN